MALFAGVLNVLIVICSLFLVCIVLIQRGRGGGLAGAFGGLGGSSAFGTKAGDVFTKVTVVAAIIWFLLAMALVIVNNRGQTSAFDDAAGSMTTREVAPTQTGGSPGTTTTSPDAAKSAGSDASTSTTKAGDLGLPPALTDEETPGASAGEDSGTEGGSTSP